PATNLVANAAPSPMNSRQPGSPTPRTSRSIDTLWKPKSIHPDASTVPRAEKRAVAPGTSTAPDVIAVVSGARGAARPARGPHASPTTVTEPTAGSSAASTAQNGVSRPGVGAPSI